MLFLLISVLVNFSWARLQELLGCDSALQVPTVLPSYLQSLARTQPSIIEHNWYISWGLDTFKVLLFSLISEHSLAGERSASTYTANDMQSHTAVC